jgi:hypothetical protein
LTDGSVLNPAKTLLVNLPLNCYHFHMKITPAMRQAVLTETGRLGGKARAAKYDKKTLSKWAKKGGRPRKKAR